MADEEVDFALPGEWWSLDVRGTPESVDRRIRSLVDRVVGRQDDRAGLRRLAREHLEQAAAQGRTIRADHIHIARTIMGGVPISATLTVSRPGVNLPANGTPETQADALLAMVAGSMPTVIEHPRVAIVRSVDIAAPESGGERLPHLTVNYWIQLPDTGHLVVFTFTSAMTHLATELTLLFDAIAFSVHPRAGKVTAAEAPATTS